MQIEHNPLAFLRAPSHLHPAEVTPPMAERRAGVEVLQSLGQLVDDAAVGLGVPLSLLLLSSSLRRGGVIGNGIHDSPRLRGPQRQHRHLHPFRELTFQHHLEVTPLVQSGIIVILVFHLIIIVWWNFPKGDSNQDSKYHFRFEPIGRE